ncbi:MAG: hypothetical protein Q8N53_22980 [Longimicrobiales bacterium]|nr:hypothetical protein [Longimicrobiales bacterium]
MTPTRSALALILLVGGAAACGSGPLGPDEDGSLLLRVTVTGGIAAADYTYAVDGRAVVGVACRRLCSFAAGDTLLLMTPAQRGVLREAVTRSGLPTAASPIDFGTPCCDQFTYRVTWSSGPDERTFTGSDGTLPGDLRELVRALQLLRQGTPPLVVSQEKGLSGFAADPLQIQGAGVDGGVLWVDVSYAGGCSAHDLDAVAWTGWMESHPVQVGVAVAHDAHGDACKALVNRSLRFDLEPLRRAYAQAYGSGPATLVLRVGAAGGGEIRAVSFGF